MPIRHLVTLSVFLAACGTETPLGIEPGMGIGEVRIGARYDSLDPALLEGARPRVFDRLAFVGLPVPGLELALASTEDTAVSADARILGVATADATVPGPVRVGSTRAEVEAALGAPSESVNDVDFWETGISVTWDADRVSEVAVFAPYRDELTPPPMLPARGVTP